MEKNTYKKPELLIQEFGTEDIICVSDTGTEFSLFSLKRNVETHVDWYYDVLD